MMAGLDPGQDGIQKAEEAAKLLEQETAQRSQLLDAARQSLTRLR